MRPYKLRVDLKTVSFSEVHKVVTKYSPDRWAYGREDVDGGNPHVHYYIETRSQASIRKALVSMGLKGNGSYSLKRLTEETPVEYIAYIMKEECWDSLGIPQGILNDAQEYDLIVKDELKKKRAKALDKIIEYVEERVVFEEGKSFPSSDVLGCIIQWHIDEDKLIREFQVKSYMETIWARKNRLELQSYYMERFFRK